MDPDQPKKKYLLTAKEYTINHGPNYDETVTKFYSIKSKLGSGSYGEVKRAVHRLSGFFLNLI